MAGNSQRRGAMRKPGTKKGAVVGSGGQLRPGDFRPNQPFSARVVDKVQVFLACEIDKNEMTFNAISRTGEVVDSGVVARRQAN